MIGTNHIKKHNFEKVHTNIPIIVIPFSKHFLSNKNNFFNSNKNDERYFQSLCTCPITSTNINNKVIIHTFFFGNFIFVGYLYSLMSTELIIIVSSAVLHHFAEIV